MKERVDLGYSGPCNYRSNFEIGEGSKEYPYRPFLGVHIVNVLKEAALLARLSAGERFFEFSGQIVSIDGSFNTEIVKRNMVPGKIADLISKKAYELRRTGIIHPEEVLEFA